jgi:hypothetical protein
MTTSEKKPKTDAQLAAQAKAKAKAKMRAGMNRRSRICSECNKFCSIEVADPEVEAAEVDGNTLTGSVTVTLQSACCGADLVEEASQELEFEVDLDDAHSDCMAEPDTCQECNGTGYEVETCPTCEGTGTLTAAQLDEDQDGACPDCNGGKIETECDHCEGEGTEPWTDEDERYTVESYSADSVTDSVTKDRRGNPIRNPRYQATLYGAEVTVEVECHRCNQSFDMVETVTERASSY